jgi:hypothetical protein
MSVDDSAPSHSMVENSPWRSDEGIEIVLMFHTSVLRSVDFVFFLLLEIDLMDSWILVFFPMNFASSARELRI